MSAKNAAYIAMSAVILCVCSWLTIPFTVPFTMQTFGVYCALLILGGKRGMAAIGLYLLLGIAGLPVFSGFRGGLGHVLGPTGGYIVGFLFTALAVGLAVDRFGRGLPVLLISMAQGVLLCYGFGTLCRISHHQHGLA